HSNSRTRRMHRAILISEGLEIHSHRPNLNICEKDWLPIESPHTGWIGKSDSRGMTPTPHALESHWSLLQHHDPRRAVRHFPEGEKQDRIINTIPIKVR